MEQYIEDAFMVIPWLIPAAFLAITFAIYRRHRRWVDAPKTRVEAEIVRIEESRGQDDDQTSYTPIYRFRTSLGQTVEAPEMGSSWSSPPVGTRCTVFYDRDDPSQVSTREGGVPGWAWLLLAAMNLLALGMAWWFTRAVSG